MSGFFTYRNFSLSDTPPLNGKVAVMTGGQAGIGKGKQWLPWSSKLEITAQLLLHGIQKVFVVARSKDKFLVAFDEWKSRKDISLGKDEERIEYIKCDLSDIEDAKRAADQIRQRTNRLHIVICNAGLGVSLQYRRTRQNIEWVFAANCVGHQVLVTLLLPLLKETTIEDKTNDARIVVTSSSMHPLCRKLDLDLLATPTRPKLTFYDGVWRYARSKLGNVLFTRELSRRLLETGDAASRNIYVNCFFPGNIVTDQWNVWNEYFGTVLASMLRGLFSIVGQTPQEGAATAIYLAASCEVRQKDIRGQYFIPIAKSCATSPTGDDVNLAKDLWDWIDAKITETLGPDWQSETGDNPVGPRPKVTKAGGGKSTVTRPV